MAFVVSLNLHRRHLDESQRAMVAGKLATLRDGQRAARAASIDAPSVTQTQAAELLNVSRKSVQRAREVLDHGTPELVAAVERGEVSVSAAAVAAAHGALQRHDGPAGAALKAGVAVRRIGN